MPLSSLSDSVCFRLFINVHTNMNEDYIKTECIITFYLDK